jgi:hypothetical protein
LRNAISLVGKAVNLRYKPQQKKINEHSSS